jgi:hypothetical protein
MSKPTSTPFTRAALAGLTLAALVTASCASTTNQDGLASETTSTASTPTTTEVQVAESTIPSIKVQPDPPQPDIDDATDEPTVDDSSEENQAETPSGDVDEADPSTKVEGLEVLYMGHSFGRPFAENMEAAADLAGIEGHNQLIVSRGGEKGAPQAMWEAPNVQEKIKAELDTGTVDVLVMICCSKELLNSGVTESWAELEIADYALAQNPDTRIGLAMPWADFPRNFNDSAEHRERTDDGYQAFQAFAEQLSADLGGADVFTFYHGAAIYELRDMFEQGALPEIESFIGPRATSIFTDEKGHAGLLAKDTGTLIWLNAIYGIEPLDVAMLDNYEIDIRQVAANALESTAVA